jgi:Holliday junction DNA helicase RuvA
MIGYLEGTLLKKDDDRILLLANQVGYEVLLPVVVMESLNTKEIGEKISLYIYFHQTERQPKPVLIGFNLEIEKDFFQHFISVEAIGPLKAVKALDSSISDIARAIESRDVSRLKMLKGIGARMAQKIIATLEGKMDRFVLTRKDETVDAPLEDFVSQVFEVLVSQLGHKPLEAKQLVTSAMERNSSISTAEDLFDEIYRGERTETDDR